MGGEDKIRVAVNTCDMVRSLGHPLLQPINAFSQLASHTEYIESLLRSLTSLSALAPYVRESRAQYKHLSDLSGFPNHGESLAGPSAVNPPVDMASASASYPFAPFPDVSSSRARVERESQSAVRAGKKRKVPPHSVSSQSSTRSSSETQRNNASNPHPKRREIASRHHNHEETDQGESSDEQSESFVTGNSADRLARTHHRALVLVALPYLWSQLLHRNQRLRVRPGVAVVLWMRPCQWTMPPKATRHEPPLAVGSAKPQVQDQIVTTRTIRGTVSVIM